MIPSDFFQDYPAIAAHHPIRAILQILVGILCVLAGAIMIFSPGQGVLTILFGVSLLPFPGRARWLARHMKDSKALIFINRQRANFRRDPLVFVGQQSSLE
jgi:hypothetical protein